MGGLGDGLGASARAMIFILRQGLTKLLSAQAGLELTIGPRPVLPHLSVQPHVHGANLPCARVDAEELGAALLQDGVVECCVVCVGVVSISGLGPGHIGAWGGWKHRQSGHGPGLDLVCQMWPPAAQRLGPQQPLHRPEHRVGELSRPHVAPQKVPPGPMANSEDGARQKDSPPTEEQAAGKSGPP